MQVNNQIDRQINNLVAKHMHKVHRPSVERDKTKYTRKHKHKGVDKE